jgi:hypothetical protein
MSLQPQTIQSLKKALSGVRLEAYRPRGGSDGDAIANYLWNAALCEALFPMLQQLEVSLRNSLHTAIGNAIGNTAWLGNNPTWLLTRELEKIEKAKQDLRDQKQDVTEDRIVGELSFGFWTGLTNRPYDKAWPKFVKQAFPYAPNHNKNRVEISARVNKLRKLRNAVFHHHSIWHWGDLAEHHHTGFEIIEWIEPELAKLVKATDRFLVVKNEGPGPFKALF